MHILYSLGKNQYWLCNRMWVKNIQFSIRTWHHLVREDVRNLILGYPSLKNKNFGTFLGEIHRINPEILGYPRIPGYPLTTSLHLVPNKLYLYIYQQESYSDTKWFPFLMTYNHDWASNLQFFYSLNFYLPLLYISYSYR